MPLAEAPRATDSVPSPSPLVRPARRAPRSLPAVEVPEAQPTEAEPLAFTVVPDAALQPLKAATSNGPDSSDTELLDRLNDRARRAAEAQLLRRVGGRTE